MGDGLEGYSGVFMRTIHLCSKVFMRFCREAARTCVALSYLFHPRSNFRCSSFSASAICFLRSSQLKVMMNVMMGTGSKHVKVG